MIPAVYCCDCSQPSRKSIVDVALHGLYMLAMTMLVVVFSIAVKSPVVLIVVGTSRKVDAIVERTRVMVCGLVGGNAGKEIQ